MVMVECIRERVIEAIATVTGRLITRVQSSSQRVDDPDLPRPLGGGICGLFTDKNMAACDS